MRMTLSTKATWKLLEYVWKLEEENKKLKEMYNVYVTGTLKLKEENKKLKNKIKNWGNIIEVIGNCVMLAFFCFMWAWMLCMLFQMVVDIIMWFQFVRWL